VHLNTQPLVATHIEPLLTVNDLVVRFASSRGTVHAVDGVSLSIKPGETLGLVGESGCGKSTLGRAIARLVEPQSGSVRLGGVDLTRLTRSGMRPYRRDIQVVFQDPLASLDPRCTVGMLIGDPLRIHGIGDRRQRRDRIADLLSKVGLSADSADRYPHQFSGGQRQRIGIARALALDPRLIILDEPVSALDVSVQAQILNLLVDLQSKLGVAYLFISHDLSVVEYVSDRVAVMYLGRIVETSTREKLWSSPAHPYTRALFDSIPRIDTGDLGRRRHMVQGDLPSAYNPPAGCHFHTRCPRAEEFCAVESPILRTVADRHVAACHFA
jgi:peptide/nickel transport system ATP-binding protein